MYSTYVVNDYFITNLDISNLLVTSEPSLYHIIYYTYIHHHVGMLLES